MIAYFAVCHVICHHNFYCALLLVEQIQIPPKYHNTFNTDNSSDEKYTFSGVTEAKIKKNVQVLG